MVDKILVAGTRTFGETVTFYPKCGGVFKVKGVFDNDFQLVDPQTDQLVSANQPALGINLNDIKFELKVGDEVEIRKARFKVQQKNEDGQGGATLFLHNIKISEANRETRINKV